tara:strand:- start:17069 stop:18493 length:1425 start_codon:yes stop_codon:yes gene_type:complete
MKRLHLLIALLLAALQSSSLGWDAKTAEDVVVRVAIFTSSGKYSGHGSGFVVSRDGHVVTNNHVVRGAGTLLVIRKESPQEMGVYKAEVLFNDSGLDMAIIKAKGMKGGPISTLATEVPPKGDRVYAAGFPGQNDDIKDLIALLNKIMSADEFPIHRKIDSTTEDALDVSIKPGFIEQVSTSSWLRASTGSGGGVELEIIKHSASIVHGNSGGPLFDEKTRVIGINTAGNADEKTYNNLRLSGRITELIDARAFKDHDIHPIISGNTVTALSLADPKILLLIVLVMALCGMGTLLVVHKQRAAAGARGPVLVRGDGRTPHAPSQNDQALTLGTGGEVLGRRSPDTKIAGSGGNRRGMPPAQSNGRNRWVLEGNGPDGRHHRLELDNRRLSQSTSGLKIGRKRESADIELDDSSVSRPHARVFLRKTSLYLEDLGSSNGSFVNGERLGGKIQAIKLKENSEVKLGEVRLRFLPLR